LKVFGVYPKKTPQPKFGGLERIDRRKMKFEKEEKNPKFLWQKSPRKDGRREGNGKESNSIFRITPQSFLFLKIS